MWSVEVSIFWAMHLFADRRLPICLLPACRPASMRACLPAFSPTACLPACCHSPIHPGCLAVVTTTAAAAAVVAIAADGDEDEDPISNGVSKTPQFKPWILGSSPPPLPSPPGHPAACNAGQIVEDAGYSPCTDCLPGTYSNLTAPAGGVLLPKQCLTCPTYTKAPDPGTAQCEMCPSDMGSNPDHTDCGEQFAGSVSWLLVGLGGALQCLVGCSCREQLVGCLL